MVIKMKSLVFEYLFCHLYFCIYPEIAMLLNTRTVSHSNIASFQIIDHNDAMALWVSTHRKYKSTYEKIKKYIFFIIFLHLHCWCTIKIILFYLKNFSQKKLYINGGTNSITKLMNTHSVAIEIEGPHIALFFIIS